MRNHTAGPTMVTPAGNVDQAAKSAGAPMLTKWVFRANKEETKPLEKEGVDVKNHVPSHLRPRAISDITFELKQEHELHAERRVRKDKMPPDNSVKRSSTKNAEKAKL